MTDGFINIEYTSKNMDRYLVRTSIKKAMLLASTKFKGQLLDIGCGKMPYKSLLYNNASIDSYTGLDIDTALQYDEKIDADVVWDGTKMPFDDAQFNCAMATEVLEHCPDPELVLKETYRVLKNDGVLFFTVPYLWPLHETPNDQYRYTPFALRRHLEQSGFKHVDISALGGWHAAMAQMLGLWLRRSPMSSRKRHYLSKLMFPVYKYLIRKDNAENVEFVDGQMITGLFGFAYK
ncbi:MAG: class I SAM-dependent methyltransferase [Flavobacteriaceae bacterium]